MSESSTADQDPRSSELPSMHSNGSGGDLPPTNDSGRSSEQPGDGGGRRGSRRHRGEVIDGKYTLRKRLGGGGFGEVWLADQQDPFRRVAVKFIRADKVSEETLSRFRLERQITALLDHPAIAKIFDSGVLEEGSPYSVMEFVEGVPLNEYCDREKRSVHERLELFALICDGVQHAHQKGLIHRDLSPDNILVTIDPDSKQPVPKIIDFGIAKVVDKNLKIVDGTLTLDLNVLLGKPEYMAPEQAEAATIGVDTRADVFSLGVILYELLSGTLPLPPESVRGRVIEEVLRAVREPRPEPSTRFLLLDEQTKSTYGLRRGDLTSEQLKRLLKGRVRHLAMTALRADRTKRFQTAEAMAVDVRSYLDNRDFQYAAAEALQDKVQRHLLRFKFRYATALLLLLSLVGGVVASSIGFARARSQAAALLVSRNAERDAKESAQNALEARDAALKDARATLSKLYFDRYSAARQLRDFGASALWLAAAAELSDQQTRADQLRAACAYALLDQPIWSSPAAELFREIAVCPDQSGIFLRSATGNVYKGVSTHAGRWTFSSVLASGSNRGDLAAISMGRAIGVLGYRVVLFGSDGSPSKLYPTETAEEDRELAASICADETSNSAFFVSSNRLIQWSIAEGKETTSWALTDKPIEKVDQILVAPTRSLAIVALKTGNQSQIVVFNLKDGVVKFSLPGRAWQRVAIDPSGESLLLLGDPSGNASHLAELECFDLSDGHSKWTIRRPWVLEGFSAIGTSGVELLGREGQRWLVDWSGRYRVKPQLTGVARVHAAAWQDGRWWLCQDGYPFVVDELGDIEANGPETEFAFSVRRSLDGNLICAAEGATVKIDADSGRIAASLSVGALRSMADVADLPEGGGFIGLRGEQLVRIDADGSETARVRLAAGRPGGDSNIAPPETDFLLAQSGRVVYAPIEEGFARLDAHSLRTQRILASRPAIAVAASDRTVFFVIGNPVLQRLELFEDDPAADKITLRGAWGVRVNDVSAVAIDTSRARVFWSLRNQGSLWNGSWLDQQGSDYRKPTRGVERSKGRAGTIYGMTICSDGSIVTRWGGGEIVRYLVDEEAAAEIETIRFGQNYLARNTVALDDGSIVVLSSLGQLQRRRGTASKHGESLWGGASGEKGSSIGPGWTVATIDSNLVLRSRDRKPIILGTPKSVAWYQRVAANASGDRLVSLTDAGSMVVWEIKEGVPVDRVGTELEVGAVGGDASFLSDTEVLVVAQGSAAIIDIRDPIRPAERTRLSTETLPTADRGAVTGDQLCLAANDSSTLEILSWSTRQLLHRVTLPHAVRSLACISEPERLAIVGGTDAVTLVRLEDGSILATIPIVSLQRTGAYVRTLLPLKAPGIVAAGGFGMIAYVDVVSRSIVGTVPIGDYPWQFLEDRRRGRLLWRGDTRWGQTPLPAFDTRSPELKELSAMLGMRIVSGEQVSIDGKSFELTPSPHR